MLVVSPWTLFLLASDDRCSSNYFEDYCEEESNRTIKTFVRIIISGRFNATNLTKSFLYGPNPASFWFSSFSQNNNRYWQYIIWLKNHRWCAWDLNLGPQDGRRRWIHWTMAVLSFVCKMYSRNSAVRTRCDQCDQIGWFIGLWAAF